VAQVIERLPSKHETLSSNAVPQKATAQQKNRVNGIDFFFSKSHVLK
jgi:hypothetical protein